jgi:hypothetical protein
MGFNSDIGIQIEDFMALLWMLTPWNPHLARGIEHVSGYSPP